MYERIATLSRRTKTLTLLGIDFAGIVVAWWAALAVRLSDPWPAEELARTLPLLSLLLAGGLALSRWMRLHALHLGSYEHRALAQSFAWILALASAATLANAALGLGAPRTVPLIFGAILLAVVLSTRLALLALLSHLRQREGRAVPVAVYGAGAAGLQMIAALQRSAEYRPTALVDDNAALWDVAMAGLRVTGPDRLADLVARGRVERVFLAIPSLTPTKRRACLRGLATLGVPVEALPSYVDMVGARTLLDSLRPIAPEDLLGRDRVALDAPEIAAAYAARAVMVSGAGGSIGSELCRQVVAAGAARLTLLEHAEHALYLIHRELEPLAAETGTRLDPVLASVGHATRVAAALDAAGTEIVLHAAAYKHVPLVEGNECAGAANNVLGTKVLAEAALAAGVRRFILVSTDKAVRPTNVMGATKRMAELVVQDMQARARLQGSRCVFSMVRFGNVLGSSGSVIPLFREQIRTGGPITLTHPEVTRYFMTIPEAARLVLLAGSYAAGGEVFVLDMGRPVRIADLARRMVELSGLTVRDAANPDGDIEISLTGLRPGEKLYEELLIGGATLPTPHPKILRAEEGHLTGPRTSEVVERLRIALRRGDPAAVRATLADCVDGYRPAVAPARGGTADAAPAEPRRATA